MSVMTMMAPLLNGVELTPGQLAELRAIDSFYYTHLATHSGSESEAGIHERVLTRVRDMLREEQRLVFDRNREASGSCAARDSARIERHR
ncbi:MAG: hypothetical protein ABI884_10000 [Gemmatimonadota bacterium]